MIYLRSGCVECGAAGSSLESFRGAGQLCRIELAWLAAVTAAAEECVSAGGLEGVSGRGLSW